MSERRGLHVFGAGRPDAGRRHRGARGDSRRSKRVRLAAERTVLDAQGRRVCVQELAGAHDVATTERLVREVVEDSEPMGWLVLDLHRVREMGPAAVALLVRLLTQLRADGVAVVVVPPREPGVRRATAEVAAAATTDVVDADAALQWCEDGALAEAGLVTGPPEALLPLSQQDLLVGLSEPALAALEAATVTRVYTPGSLVFAEGAASDGLYFVAAGQVSAVVRGGAPTARRLSTMGPGSSFGELALVDGSSRSTSIVADEPTLCHVLTNEAFEALVTGDPAAGTELHRAIARSLSARLRQATPEIAVLDSHL